MRMLLLALTVFLVATGCGGDDGTSGEPSAGSGSRSDQLTRAASKLDGAGTYSAGMVAEVTGEEPFKMDGKILGTTDGSRVLTIATVTSGGQEFQFEMMQFGTEQFSKGGALTDQLPPGKEWTRSTDDTPSSTLPVSTLLNFMAATDDFEHQGSETISGKGTDHYEGVLDLEAFAEYAGPKAAESLSNVPQAEDFELRLGLWIGSDDLPARFRMTVEPERGAEAFRFVTTMDFRSFGDPLHFKRPDPATVA